MENNSLIEIVCKIPGTFKVTGIPSHKDYIFVNSKLTNPPLNIEDIPDLLSKKTPGGCCGSPREPQTIFELVE